MNTPADPSLRSLTAAALLAALPFLLIPSPARAENEIGFIEKFALAPDREKVLGELVPGSEDYYFFSALHYQNTRNEAKLAELLAQWEKRSPNENPRRRIILNREALLDYDATPQQTLAYLRERLGLQFNHQQEARDKKPDLPVALDAARIARDVFLQDALRNDQGLQSLTVEEIESLITNKVKLSDQQIRAALGKLQRPDVPGLVEFIAAELKMKDTQGFGAFAIHGALLPTQLDALAKLVPDLTKNESFVYTKVRKLAPGADADVQFDPAAREAWLTRLGDYVQTLPPAFNTLKASTLYQRLDHDRQQGIYDQARFLAYLKLPRPLGYVNPEWLKALQQREPMSDMNANLSGPLLNGRPVGNDEPLVLEYFLNLFDRAATANPGQVGAAMLKPYTDYVRDTWLKPVLAEALITGGHGNPEQWASLLSPTAFQSLKERVDIEFPATNATSFKPALGGQPGDSVEFDVVVKNAPELLVRIYEVNTLNFFLTEGRQLNTDLNLDGLVANSEEKHAFESGPFKRTRQTFKFPALTGKRGAWIIEFIGGGRSSRALVRNGQWSVLQTTGPAGDLLTVLDENGDQVKDAVLWLDGRKFTPDKKIGRILVPFTNQPGIRTAVVAEADGSFATLTQFEHHAENYVLDTQFHITREQLLAGRTATLAVRTALMVGESHLSQDLLSEPKLTITSTTQDGVSTTREVKNLKLDATAALTHDLTVPERLASLTVVFSAKIEMISAGGEKRDLSASHTWTLNGIDQTAATNDGHLANFGGNFTYELLGKNGEPIADQQIVFTFAHHGFSRPQTIALKTDEQGRVALGALAGLTSLSAQAPNGRESRWELDDFERTWPSLITAKAGDTVTVPLPASLSDAKNLPAAISLLELRAGTPVADLSTTLVAKDGFLLIPKLPAGDYSLRFRAEDREITIKATDGPVKHGWILGKARHLEAKGQASLQITSITQGNDVIEIKLANTNPFTRVHLAATLFDPGQGLFASLGGFARFGASEAAPGKNPNLYSAGREIGDEYRYILDRRSAKLLPGNMLTRPGLLLNPWEVRDTDTEDLAQQAGQAADLTRGGRGGALFSAAKEKAAAKRGAIPGGAAADTNLDFLATAAPVLYNLHPDKDGIIRLDRKALGDRQHIQVYAEDPANAVWRTFALPEKATPFTELRLLANLDPTKPFTQRKETTVLNKGGTLTIADVLTGELETYDTLSSVHALLTTLSGDANLAEFAWVLQWPKLKDDEKRAKYSEYACHELSFFLSRKDPDFFAKVVKPYLANKKDRTFMDDYLLENDLASYLQPWAYERLNAAERVLLGLRIKAQTTDIARALREQWELITPDPELQDHLFETALRGRSMEQAEAGGLGAAMQGERNRAGAKREEKFNNTADDAFVDAAPAPPATPEPQAAAARESEESGPHDDPFAAAPDQDKSAKRMRKQLAQLADGEVALEALANEKKDADFAFFGDRASNRARELVRAYFRPLGPTKEWAENNYYKLRITAQDASLIPVNGFWRDYAAWSAEGAKPPFLSSNLAETGRTFAEMMLALAVLDLPFEAPKHTVKTADGALTLTAGGPVIAYHKEIKPAAPADAQQGGLLVSESFFRQDDRYRQDGNERFEKYVTEEFLTGAVFGANVVVTNPTSAPVKAEVLLQIPQGALPVLGSKATDSRQVRLEPYTTQTFEYFFYFPATAKEGKFAHYPVHVSIAGRSAAGANQFAFNVVDKLTQFDKASWHYVSQYGTADEVFAFLEANNLARLDFNLLAWRCKEDGFFGKLTAFMARHHIWNPTIYSYAVVHNEPTALREWLRHQDQFVNQCGPWLATKLILLDPIERRSYEHLGYSPLVNQRAHRLGSAWRIANPAVLGQYRHLLDILAHKPQLDAMDSMSVTYYLFLQDRVEEALARFHAIDPKLLPTRLQHDYFRCYAAFYEDNLAEARGLAAGYSDFPVPRWRELFAEVTSQLDEIEGKAAATKDGDQPDREKQQAELAATEPTFDFKVEGGTITLNYRNLEKVTVNYYLMDPEFSFSSNPFVSTDASRFSIIKPNKSATQALPRNKDTAAIPLPAEFSKANVLVEILGAGQRKAQPYHANTLKLALAENYGRLEVRDSATNKPLPKAYVKVYARLDNGTIRFFKDGYTDLRGRFDYASLNGGDQQAQPLPREPAPANGLDYQMLKPTELQQVEKLAILILSDTHGADTREVAPPSE